MKPTFPARCAVAVVCGEHLVSQVYPASIPIEVFIDDAVGLVGEELRRRGADGPEPGLSAGAAYTFHRADGTSLDLTRTLDELGIDDGSTLVLAASAGGEAFEPHYESLSTGLAKTARRLFPVVTERTAAQTAVVILGLVTATVLVLAYRIRAGSDSLVPAAVAGGSGLMLGLGALWVRRWWPQRADLLAGFGWLAIAPLALGSAAVAPGTLGCSHAFIAALAAVVLTCCATSLTGRYMAFGAAAATLCTLGGLIAAARMGRPIPVPVLGVGTLIALLFLLAGAPAIALRVARVRPPHFGSVTGRDLFRRRDGMPVDVVAPVDPGDQPGDDHPIGVPSNDDPPKGARTDDARTKPDSTPSGASIVAAAVRANAVLTGICVAAATALPLAVWATVVPGYPNCTAAAVLSAVLVLIFISRARSFADRRQAVPLVCGAAAAFCVGVARQVSSQPGSAALLWGSLILIGFGAAGLAAALLVPAAQFTPLVRMVAEWLELVAIAAALPLAAWCGGLFTWVRMR